MLYASNSPAIKKHLPAFPLAQTSVVCSMALYQPTTRLIAFPAVLITIAAGMFTSCSQPGFAYKGKIPRPVKNITLNDSSSVWLQKDTRITTADAYPQKRELEIDGDLFMDVPDNSTPLIIRTRLLKLTVNGKAAFRVIAFAKEDGEEVQVINGHILVDKNYESPFNEQDTLRNNQMVMINKTIDLMEKEKFDATDLAAWRAALK